MSVCTHELQYRRLRAPEEDRGILVDPPLAEMGPVVDENVRRISEYDYDCQGRSLTELSRHARELLVAEAWRLTTAYRDVTSAPDRPDGPMIFLAGHQPQLFHPGVWAKNFALGFLARRHGAVAVNLLIDSDTVKSTSLRVPLGPVSDPRTEMIPFDRLEPRIPYEGRRIVDWELFDDFGRRVSERIAPLVSHPMIEQYWPLVRQQARRTDNLGACLAQGRHRLEADWGLQTLEVPQSRVCRTEPFCWFVAHLLAQAPRLWRIYNEAVLEYRRVHRIRSAAHPVPELSSEGRRLEVPFWVSTAEDPRRRALFAEYHGNHLELSDPDGLRIDLPLAPDGDAAGAVQRLMELSGQGVNIRSRALITTLWARLALGDLFVHGIGGAKYDQLTDVLIERFFGIKSPQYAVVSATLHLPIERAEVSVEQLRTIRRRLRELNYHPERFIDHPDDEAVGIRQDPAELIAAKIRWIRTAVTSQNARTRCQSIRRINRQLQPWVESRRRQFREIEAQTDQALRAAAILGWREYGFCLHEEKTFRGLLQELLPKTA